MGKTELSIVMPVFNKAEMVSEMIDSIQANDYHDWELVIVDDGSTEDTIACLTRYVQRDSRIRLVRRERQPKGAPTCRNIGFEQAHGDYVIFFDSDDYITPSCLSTRVDAIKQHPDADFLVFPSVQYKGGRMEYGSAERAYGYQVFKDDISAFTRKTLPFVVCNNIYRRNALLEHHIVWDTQLRSLQDSDFNMQCLLAGMRYEYVLTKPDYGYRIETNDNSITKRISTIEHLKSHVYALDKIYNLVQQKYRHRYDWDLFLGVLFIFQMVFVDELNVAIAKEMQLVVRSHNTFHGMIFALMLACMRMLNCIMPCLWARKLSMSLYLIWLGREMKNSEKARLEAMSGIE